MITAVAGNKPEEGGHAHGLPPDGDLLVWRSQDGGKTWSKAKPINDVPGSATEGLHALASDGMATLFAAWLDKRGSKGTKLYSARSTDGGLTWSKNVAVYQSPDGSICECCHPSVAIGAAGELVAMWRNSLLGSRDMYLATSHDGLTFSTPRKLGSGTWHLNACPMDGGGLAVSSTKTVTAWRRDADVFIAEHRSAGTASGHGQGRGAGAERRPDVRGLGQRFEGGSVDRRQGGAAFQRWSVPFTFQPARRRSARGVGGKRRHPGSTSALATGLVALW